MFPPSMRKSVGNWCKIDAFSCPLSLWHDFFSSRVAQQAYLGHNNPTGCLKDTSRGLTGCDLAPFCKGSP